MGEIERLSGDYVNVASGVAGGFGSAENHRTPTIWKMQNGASNGFTVWTPTAGKRFRCLGVSITATADISAATSEMVVVLNDNATQFGQFVCYAPVTAVTTNPGTINVCNINFPGNGYLSVAVNNTLNLGYSTLSTGKIGCTVWGTEE